MVNNVRSIFMVSIRNNKIFNKNRSNVWTNRFIRLFWLLLFSGMMALAYKIGGLQCHL